MYMTSSLTSLFVNSLSPGIFFKFFLSSANFFQNQFFRKKVFQEYHLGVKYFAKVISVGRCGIPSSFLGKSVKHTFSCRTMYSV